MTFAQVQELGKDAYDLALAMSGDDYVAATAYEEVVADLQAREAATDVMWLCPSCGKGWAAARAGRGSDQLGEHGPGGWAAIGRGGQHALGADPAHPFGIQRV